MLGSPSGLIGEVHATLQTSTPGVLVSTEKVLGCHLWLNSTFTGMLNCSETKGVELVTTIGV